MLEHGIRSDHPRRCGPHPRRTLARTILFTTRSGSRDGLRYGRVERFSKPDSPSAR